MPCAWKLACRSHQTVADGEPSSSWQDTPPSHLLPPCSPKQTPTQLGIWSYYYWKENIKNTRTNLYNHLLFMKEFEVYSDQIMEIKIRNCTTKQEGNKVVEYSSQKLYSLLPNILGVLGSSTKISVCRSLLHHLVKSRLSMFCFLRPRERKRN